MGLRAWIVGTSFAFALPCMAEEVLLQPAPWPAARECETCIPLQFGRLEMQLPRSEVSKIVVLPRGGFALLVPSTGDIVNSPALHDMDQSSTLNRYAKSDLLRKYGVTTAREFYDLVGRPAAGDRMLELAKKVELVTSATAYTKASKGALNVYRIDSAAPDSQRVYFLVDGDESLYMLSGPVSHELYTAILANLRVAKIP